VPQPNSAANRARYHPRTSLPEQLPSSEYRRPNPYRTFVDSRHISEMKIGESRFSTSQYTCPIQAAALAKTPAIRAAEIMATQAAWFAIGSDIEAARQGAKVTVTAAKGGKVAMETAAAVDWAAIGGA
jgi:hypothetical protein